MTDKGSRKLREERSHSMLKKFLIDLGRKEGCDSFSGDSECLDVRLKKKHVEYKPDVIWRSKTSCHVFEFAFTEDWRAIAGEFTLAWLAGCSSFTVFRWAEAVEGPGGIAFPPNEARFFKNLLGVLGGKFDMKWRFLSLHDIRICNSEMRRKWILLHLREWNQISEETFKSYS